MKIIKAMKLWRPKSANLIRAVLSWMLGARLPRPMQMEAWRVLTRSRERMLVASPGWGKTMMIQMIALREQMFEKDRRTIIIAPFKDIGSGYDSKKLWVPDRDWVGAAYFLTVAASAFVSLWMVAPTLLLGLPVWRRYATCTLEIENLCGDDSSRTVSRVKEFLLGDGDSKALSCCCASAARAWRELESEYDADTLRRLVRNLSPWFDECQFAKGGDRRNRLGDLLHAMVRGHESVRPGLASATPFRADGVIVHDDDIAKFERGTWRCPFDRHFAENMLRTEHMDFDYCAYEGVGGWQANLTEYVQNKGRRMLVYIPLVNTQASSGKNADYDMAETAIRSVFPDADIVNLVDDDDRENSRQLTTLRQRIKENDDPDFVISLRMMMVGSDWPNLRSIYDLAPSESLATGGQKCGRLHRDGRDKSTISNRTAFMRFGRTDAEKLRVHCSNRLNALISVLLMHYVFQGEPLFGSGGSGGGGGGQGRRNPALDWPELVQFIRIVESRLCIGTEIDNCVRVAKEVMDEMNVPDDIRPGLEHIVRDIEGTLSKKTADAVRKSGSDPVGMGELSAGMTLQFGTGKVGKELLENWRNSIRKLESHRSPEEWVLVAERLADENGGILQSYTWLSLNGYGALTTAKHQRPELFLHIRQEKNKRTAEEWVPIAEKLAIENGGAVPNAGWLQSNGCAGLPSVMLRSPELFSHLDWTKVREKPAALPSVTDEQFLEAIREHMSADQNWKPGARSKMKIPGLGVSCKQLDHSIRARGKGDTLDKMLRREGVLPPKHLTVEIVLERIRARIISEPGWLPHRSDATEIPGLPRTSCKKIDAMMKNLRGGFTRKGDTLAKMLRRNGISEAGPKTSAT